MHLFDSFLIAFSVLQGFLYIYIYVYEPTALHFSSQTHVSPLDHRFCYYLCFPVISQVWEFQNIITVKSRIEKYRQDHLPIKFLDSNVIVCELTPFEVSFWYIKWMDSCVGRKPSCASPKKKKIGLSSRIVTLVTSSRHTLSHKL